MRARYAAGADTAAGIAANDVGHDVDAGAAADAFACIPVVCTV